MKLPAVDNARTEPGAGEGWCMLTECSSVRQQTSDATVRYAAVFCLLFDRK
jgi:cytochrome c-type biogenesis protein CcmH/NrfG